MTSTHPPERRASQALLSAAAFVVVVAGLRAASQILVPFMVALVVSFVSMPLLFWLRSKRVPTALAVLFTILADAAVLAGAGYLVSTSLNELTAEIPKYQERLVELGDEVKEWLEARELPVEEWLNLRPEGEELAGNGADAGGTSETESPVAPIEPDDTDSAWWFNLFDLDQIVDVTNRALRGVAAALSNAVIIVLITTFILAEAATFKEKLRLAFGRRAWADRLGTVTEELRRYLGIKTIISLVTGLLIGSYLALLGIDFAFLWGLAAFGLNFIPNLGSILAAIPTTLLALLQHGVGVALLVALGYLVVNVVLGNLVEPHWMGRRLGLSTLVVFLSLVFWGWVWGPVGMLLSVPLTMVAKILLENSDEFRWVAILMGDASSAGRRRASAARAHRRRARRRAAAAEVEPARPAEQSPSP